MKCTLLVCVLCQPVPPSIHHFGSFRNFLSVSAYAVPPTRLHAVNWCVIRARAPTNASLIHSALTIEKRWSYSYVTVTLKIKFEMHTPREFPGYWWLFRTQYLSRYSAIGWLKKEWLMKNSDCHITVWRSLFVCFVSQCIHWVIPTSARFLFRKQLYIRTIISYTWYDYMQYMHEYIYSRIDKHHYSSCTTNWSCALWKKGHFELIVLRELVRAFLNKQLCLTLLLYIAWESHDSDELLRVQGYYATNAKQMMLTRTLNYTSSKSAQGNKM